MTCSSLTDVVILSPNGYFPRAYGISKITIHHMAGVMTAEQCGYVFQSTARQASSNYGIGNDGRIGCYVEEENAAWTSSNWENDNRAITIEVSNSYAGDPWPISDAAYKSLIALVADVCNRYGITPYYDGTPNASFTEHRMFAATGCPGQYIHERMYQIVEDVKAAMAGGKDEWIYDADSDRWWYRHADGSYTKKGWEFINDKWYYFDSKGWMKTGWVVWKGERYYCQPKTKATGDSYGYMVAGVVKKIGGKIYSFDDEGKMRRNCFIVSAKGNWYAYGPDGARVMDASKFSVNPKTGVITIK